jgi:hypothetical protein
MIARPRMAKYAGMLKGMSFSTVSASCVMAWKPPTAPTAESSILYVFLSASSYFLAPPPAT